MGYINYYRMPGQKRYYLKHCKGQSHAFRKHVHQEYSIALVTHGESHFQFVDEVFQIRRMQLVVIGPNVVHQCCPTCVTDWGFYMLHVSPSWVKETGFETDGLPDFSIHDLSEDSFLKIVAYFEQVCINGDDAIESIVLIMEFAFSTLQVQAFENALNNSRDYNVEGVYELIRNRFKETITLDELACLSGMDQYTLIRQFNRVYNTTPHALQIMFRVNEAKKILEQGKSIADAALEVGFYDQSHFSKTFKDSFGVTPKQYVESHA